MSASPSLPPVLLRMGFRPFFFGAVVFALVTMALWATLWHGLVALPMAPASAFQWHAHEMIYGYAIAVVAGFLLTAVRNWTAIDTLRGWPLAALVALWAGARLALLFGTQYALVAAVCDLLFASGLFVAIALPLVRAKLWRQAGILAKILLLASANGAFYLGLFGLLERGVEWSVYGGLYLLVSLILTIATRVLPGFIERGVGYPLRLSNPRALTVASLALFVPFFVVELFTRNSTVSGILAAGLVLVNSIRLVLWHSVGIWRKPLLWGLYLSFAFVVAGFALLALAAFANVPKLLAIHAFGVGGVGLATLSMMARVTLGHTGRDVRTSAFSVSLALGLLVLAALARFALPLVAPLHYSAAISVAQVLWLAAFAIFALSFLPILLRPRADGQPG